MSVFGDLVQRLIFVVILASAGCRSEEHLAARMNFKTEAFSWALFLSRAIIDDGGLGCRPSSMLEGDVSRAAYELLDAAGEQDIGLTVKKSLYEDYWGNQYEMFLVEGEVPHDKVLTIQSRGANRGVGIRRDELRLLVTFNDEGKYEMLWDLQ